MYVDVRLSHPNKDYLLTYLLPLLLDADHNTSHPHEGE